MPRGLFFKKKINLSFIVPSCVGKYSLSLGPFCTLLVNVYYIFLSLTENQIWERESEINDNLYSTVCRLLQVFSIINTCAWFDFFLFLFFFFFFFCLPRTHGHRMVHQYQWRHLCVISLFKWRQVGLGGRTLTDRPAIADDRVHN